MINLCQFSISERAEKTKKELEKFVKWQWFGYVSHILNWLKWYTSLLWFDRKKREWGTCVQDSMKKLWKVIIILIIIICENFVKTQCVLNVFNQIPFFLTVLPKKEKRKKGWIKTKMSSSKMKRFVSIKGVIDNLRQSVNSPSPNSGNSNNSGGNSGNEGPASLEQDLIESLAPGQFTAELTLRHGFPNKPTGKSFFNPFLSYNLLVRTFNEVLGK